MSQDLDTARIEAALATLVEHFDTVQIFCTRHEAPEGTIQIMRGRGNWFARYGQLVEYVEKCKEEPRITARLERENED